MSTEYVFGGNPHDERQSPNHLKDIQSPVKGYKCPLLM